MECERYNTIFIDLQENKNPKRKRKYENSIKINGKRHLTQEICWPEK